MELYPVDAKIKLPTLALLSVNIGCCIYAYIQSVLFYTHSSVTARLHVGHLPNTVSQQGNLKSVSVLWYLLHI